MGIGDAITLVSCLAGLMLALPALLLFLNLAFPRLSYDAAIRLNRGMILPFFIGLIPAILIGIPGAFLLSLGSVFQFCGSIFYLALFLWAFLGMSATGYYLGMQFGQRTDQAEDAVRETMTGTLILTFAVAFPILGWFVILPFSMIIGVGATIITVVRRFFSRRKPHPERATAEYMDNTG